MAPYQYTPLNIETGEIRVLELHPGIFEATVRISIIKTPFARPPPTQIDQHRLTRVQGTLPPQWRVHENLDGRLLFRDTKMHRTTWLHPDPDYSSIDCSGGKHPTALCRPSYEALSYVWGTEAATTRIEVVPSTFWDDASATLHKHENVSLYVRQNLYDAMKHLRVQNTSRFLWIDAISINQTDLVERNQQVGRMGDIYKHASRVIVWLGLASPSSGTAMGLMKYLGDQVVFTKTYRVLSAPSCDDPDLWDHRDAQSIESNIKIWDTIYHLLQRSWFDRLWILQEIQLANSSALVYCGYDTISWVRLRIAIRTCAHLRFPGVHLKELHRLAFKRKQLTYNATDLGPLRLLGLALSSGCEDMRDKVYSLLGLFPEVFSRRIRPSYDRPALEVHRDVVRTYINCTGSLDILLLAGPSWTPNWSVLREPLSGDGNFCSGKSEANISQGGQDELTATGIIYDSIETIAGPLADNDDKSIVDVIGTVCLNNASPTGSYPTGETLAEACAWLLNSGHLQERWGENQLMTTVAEASQIFHCIGNRPNMEPGSDAPLLRSTVVEGAFTFKTSKGYFGFCCQKIMPGDRVSVLLGSSCPVVLREQADNRYLFVGCAYVHGIMDGEALLGSLGDHVAIAEHGRHSDVFQVFMNTTTNVETRDDPRLGPLPAAWSEIVTKDRLWPERTTVAFQNKVTKEVIFSDPRLLPAALTDRGVPLQHLKLV